MTQCNRECIGDVEAETVITAAVRAQLFAIDEHGRLPIHGPEVEQHALAPPRAGHFERAVIPQALASTYSDLEGKIV
jgi:hypothetical protein